MALQGLPQRLIQDGLVDEKTMMQAMTAAKEANANLVSHLVANGLADAREIAIAASQEFGVPLLDLDAIQLDLDVVKLVSDKLLAKHRVLPLMKRGKRLFVAVSDPTNLHALDEIKFQTGLSIEAIVVEEDKLQTIASKAIEQVDTQMPNLATTTIWTWKISKSPAATKTTTTTRRPRRRRRRAHRALRQQGAAGRHQARRLRHSLRALRKDLSHSPAAGRLLKEIAQPAGAAGDQARGASQSHVASGHRRTAHPAGRPHQDAHLEEPRHRLPRQHLPDAVRRKDRRAYSRSVQRHARHRRARLRGRRRKICT